MKYKFRGIYQNTWVYGNLIQGVGFDGEELCQIENTDPEEFRQWDVDPETVGLFAGLDNKNLWQGDIFHLGDPNITYVVEWFDCGLKGRQVGNMSSVGLVHWKDKIKIIGSIHDKLIN